LPAAGQGAARAAVGGRIGATVASSVANDQRCDNWSYRAKIRESRGSPVHALNCPSAGILLRDTSQSSARAAFRDWRLARLSSWLACAGALTSGFPGAATAEPAAPFSVRLHYEVDAAALGCGSEREFRRGVTRALGYDPFRAEAAMGVEVHISRAADSVDGHVEWKAASGAGMGERTFHANDGDCAKMLREMSFAVGLQIDLLRPSPRRGDSDEARGSTNENAAGGGAGRSASSAPAASNSSQTSSSSLDSPPATGTSDGARARADFDRWQLWVGAGPSLTWGVLPALSAEGRVFLGARRRDVSLELGGGGTLPVVARQVDGSGFRARLVVGGAAICGHRGLFSGCLLGKAGALQVTGLSVDHAQSPSAFVAQAGARLAATWELAEVWLFRAHLDGLGLLTRRTVTLQHVQVWEMPRLSLSAGIDVGARFR
jgi:hypothetical protein